ncbi:MAG: hypothetical protein M1831_004038 [Alyxoria varia]|nr:MAG: hypothetical protein M1831_004038 [Alyxoria varia]
MSNNVNVKPEGFWHDKHLSPSQLLVHDIGLYDGGAGPPKLNIEEKPSSSLQIPEEEDANPNVAHFEDGLTYSERYKFNALKHRYGWMRHARLPAGTGREEKTVRNNFRKCRWIHIPSLFPEYLQGVFLGLSDWADDPENKLTALRQIGECINGNERFSKPDKDGKYFAPFFTPLSSSSEDTGSENCAILASFPFLDWTVYPGPPPPPRFQVDGRQEHPAARLMSHPLRSLLQYYYRLEDTSDREKFQVYTRHKPWNTNREIDLKVRRWYGVHPNSLLVDEMWILVIDSRHIVTFSSNQTWKSKWPPLQLSARIAEVSFRGLKSKLQMSERQRTYTALIHAIACVHGAVGLIHRNFWTDVPLPCSDRFSGLLGVLQYRLYRSPSTKLVMDLLQVQDELNIILQIIKKQEQLLTSLQEYFNEFIDGTKPPMLEGTGQRRVLINSTTSTDLGTRDTWRSRFQPSLRNNESILTTVTSDVIDRLRQEEDDLNDLKTNTNDLVNRTVQLVNIRIEDHGQAILVFTLVTVIFLPLSFLASYFSMNNVELAHVQATFWIVAAVLTLAVVGAASIIAFYGGKAMDKFFVFKENRRFWFGRRSRDVQQYTTMHNAPRNDGSFHVLDYQAYPTRSALW